MDYPCNFPSLFLSDSQNFHFPRRKIPLQSHQIQRFCHSDFTLPSQRFNDSSICCSFGFHCSSCRCLNLTSFLPSHRFKRNAGMKCMQADRKRLVIKVGTMVSPGKCGRIQVGGDW
ncbi:uncharacterized protein LOC123907829 isoform X2 [Trifolium pratense]|uniref:Uncharacterized protein n=1 Tax=Trifolium pratense TaxID=57577 RepID=A0ACB0JJM3_TRIPR|nr:uncharacterized protein LOC123907829 isoform X2 [Trifolium pratense]CAJ2645064.1 unnamed protein product [Trifolium pratense]